MRCSLSPTLPTGNHRLGVTHLSAQPPLPTQLPPFFGERLSSFHRRVGRTTGTCWVPQPGVWTCRDGPDGMGLGVRFQWPILLSEDFLT